MRRSIEHPKQALGKCRTCGSDHLRYPGDPASGSGGSWTIARGRVMLRNLASLRQPTSCPPSVAHHASKFSLRIAVCRSRLFRRPDGFVSIATAADPPAATAGSPPYPRSTVPAHGKAIHLKKTVLDTKFRGEGVCGRRFQSRWQARHRRRQRLLLRARLENARHVRRCAEGVRSAWL